MFQETVLQMVFQKDTCSTNNQVKGWKLERLKNPYDLTLNRALGGNLPQLNKFAEETTTGKCRKIRRKRNKK